MRCAEPEYGNYFVATYPPFSVWDAAGAARYGQALDAAPPDPARPLGLYVHVPFCEKRCDYCYYLSYEGRLRHGDEYVSAVLREMRLYAARPAVADRPIDFAYFGGGTPSVLSVEQLRRLFEGLQRVLPWSRAREVSFECAPRSVSVDKLRLLRDLGVTRLSLGVQDLDDAVLSGNGRAHRSEHVKRACAAIHEAGFDVFNVDLIAGLVGQTDAGFEAGVAGMIELGADCVTIYQLEVPLNTPLYRAIRDGKLAEGQVPASWVVRRARLRRGFELLEAAGYTVRSAYMAVRDVQRHRFVYQDEQYRGADLLGMGASSFSCIDGIEQQNIAALEGYLQALGSDALPVWRGHALSGEERLVRELILQIKLGAVDLAELSRRHGLDVRLHFQQPMRDLVERGLATLEASDLRLTREGLLQADRLLADFYLPQHQHVRYS